MALPPGTKLGPYEIVAQLGAGGMGEVYRARDTRLERDVAVKVLPASLASDANLRHRLEREARALSKLNHPHICTLHDIGHQDGVDFLVMELVEGETLEQRLTKGALLPVRRLRLHVDLPCATKIVEVIEEQASHECLNCLLNLANCDALFQNFFAVHIHELLRHARYSGRAYHADLGALAGRGQKLVEIVGEKLHVLTRAVLENKLKSARSADAWDRRR